MFMKSAASLNQWIALTFAVSMLGLSSGCNNNTSTKTSAQMSAPAPGNTSNIPKSSSPAGQATASPTATPDQTVTSLGKFEGTFLNMPFGSHAHLNADGTVTFVIDDSPGARIYRVGANQGLRLVYTLSGNSGFDFISFVDDHTLIFSDTGTRKSTFVFLSDTVSLQSDIPNAIQPEFGTVEVLPGYGVILANSKTYEIVKVKSDQTFDTTTVTPTNQDRFLDLGYNGVRALYTRDHDLLLGSPNNDGLQIFSDSSEPRQKLTLGSPVTDTYGVVESEFTDPSKPLQLASGAIVLKYDNEYNNQTDNDDSSSKFGIAVLKKSTLGDYTKVELDTGNYSPTTPNSFSQVPEFLELSSGTIVSMGIEDGSTVDSSPAVRFYDPTSGQLTGSFNLKKAGVPTFSIQSIKLLQNDLVIVRTNDFINDQLYVIDSSGKLFSKASVKSDEFKDFHQTADGKLVFPLKEDAELDALDPKTGVISVFKKFDNVYGEGRLIKLGVSGKFAYAGKISSSGWWANRNNFALLDDAGNTKELNVDGLSDGAAFLASADQSKVFIVENNEVMLLKL